MNLLSKLILIIFAILSAFFLVKPVVVFASCTQVASNQTDCVDPQPPIACFQPLPNPGNIRRWCCDDQRSCDIEKGKVQDDISNSGDPIPGFKIPCDEVRDPEFNSLRPYQAAPCGDAPKAYFCQNNYIIEEDVKTTWDSGLCTDSEPFTCPTNMTINKDYIVDGEDAEYPILGNTEDVKNSQKEGDSIDDATKVNEYVSWYLNGVVGRAEYGEGKNTDYELVNFSGPIQKLLPSVFLDAQRIRSIASASATTSYTTDDGEEVIDEEQNHNQIVACAKSNVGAIGDLLNIGRLTPVECYNGSGSGTGGILNLDDAFDGVELFRLITWEGDISIARDVTNVLFDLFIKVFPDVTEEMLSDALGNAWEDRKPPLPWDSTFEGDYKKYLKAYNEWKGKSCIILPFLPIPICVDNPFIPNKYADIFPYVPLANTVDKNAHHMGEGVGVKGAGQTKAERVGDYQFEKEPALFYPHTQEVFDLTNILNTFGSPKKDEGDSSDGSSAADYESNRCQIVDVRSNPGDQLFPSSKNDRHDDLTVTNVQIHVTQIGCEPAPIRKYIDECLNGPATSPSCNSEPLCKGTVEVEIRTIPKIPYGEEIWQNTVVGQDSAFRKIFPKIEEGAPVSCIADIPGVSSVTYEPATGTNLIGVDGPLGRQKLDETNLYFPHLGTVYDYFLKGIQTALRPKGYGTPIVSGKLCVDQNIQASGACKQWLFEKDASGQFYYDKIIQAAASTTCNGEQLNPYWAIGIALNENGGLMSDLVDGSATTHFGCDIQGLAGYEPTIDDKTKCMTNTLQSYCLAGKTDEEALATYGYAPGYILEPITILDYGEAYPPPIFGSGFNTGKLLLNLLNTDWVAYYGPQAPTFCPNSPTLEPTAN